MVSDGTGLALSVAGYRFPRIQALADGQVGIGRREVTFVEAAIGDLNRDVLGGTGSYDVAEIGLHPFMLAHSQGGFRDYVLLPVFPLRLFRHKSIFVRTDRGIEAPSDLKGRTVATPGYSSTSLTWIRGILQDEYGVAPEDIRWITSAQDSSASVSGRTSAQEALTPESIDIRSGPPGKDESDLLMSGEADALFHAAEPRAYMEGDPLVARLFPDYRSTERAYFAKTGVFPIMHAVAVRRALIEGHPWLVEAVFRAYSEAKQISYQRMSRLGWASDGLPWYGQELAETQGLMGTNFYPYGVEGSRPTLEALFRYSYEQGLCPTELTVEGLFHPTSLSLKEGGGLS